VLGDPDPPQAKEDKIPLAVHEESLVEKEAFVSYGWFLPST
jgi:hypothetical protein